MTKILGITGGIGSGKSVVSHILRVMEIPVYDTDSRAKVLNESDSVIREGLIELVGEKVYTYKGLNRQLLSTYLFSSPQNTERINKLIHPRVKNDFNLWAHDQSGYPLICIESAILFESGFNSLVDDTISVIASEETRIQRVIQRDKSNIEKVKARIKSQITDEQRINLSQYVIINDGNKALIPQVRKIISHYFPNIL